MDRSRSKNDNGWTERLLGEILLLSVLSKALQTYPEKVWLQSLVKEDVFSESPLVGEHPDVQAGLFLLRAWSTKNREGISEKNLQDLKVDYTQLFIGVEKVLAPSWESVYFNEDRLVFQEQTLQVRNWYRCFGLEPEKIHKEPDDHIGLQMSFVSYLAKLALQALEEQEQEKFEGLLDAQHQFLSEHLLKWGPYWCNLVSEHAQTDFYKGLALLTRGALLTLAKQFDIQISEGVVQ